MAEYLDDKFPEKWDTMASKELIVWMFHRISKRLERLEQNAGLSATDIPENEPDMNKIRRFKLKNV